MTTLDTLRLIVSRSPDAMHEALGAIRAQQVNSPMAARRAERTAAIALKDQDAAWTPSERAELAALLGEIADETRTQELRLRVTADEKAEVQAAASEVGLTVSDYIRQKIGL